MVPNLKTDEIEDGREPRASKNEPQRAWRADGADAVESPARRLQLELEKSWAPSETAERWSARRSLFFIILTNGLLWSALIWGVARIV